MRGSRARYSQPRPVLLPAVSRTQFLSLISLKRNHRLYPNENLTFNNTTLFIRALVWLQYCAVLKHELCIMIGVSLQLAPVLCRVPLSLLRCGHWHWSPHTVSLSWRMYSVLVTSPGLCPRPAPSYITQQPAQYQPCLGYTPTLTMTVVCSVKPISDPFHMPHNKAKSSMDLMKTCQCPLIMGLS